MNQPRSGGYVRMHDAEFEAILTRAAEEGAKRALADVGLDGPTRPRSTSATCAPWSTSSGWCDAPRAMQTAVRMITTGAMLALLAGIAIKL